MKDEIIIQQGGGPFSGVVDSYKWTVWGATGRNEGLNKRWLYHHHDHDSAPSVMSLGNRPDENNIERLISIGEASDLLHRCRLTEEDIPLVKVSSTPPEALEEIASKKQNSDITFHFYEIVEASPYQDQWPYLQELHSAPEGGLPRNKIAVKKIINIGHAVTKNEVSLMVHQFLEELYGIPDIPSRRRTFHPVLLEPGQELVEFEEKGGYGCEMPREYITHHGKISEEELKIIERYVRVNRMTTFNSRF